MVKRKLSYKNKNKNVKRVVPVKNPLVFSINNRISNNKVSPIYSVNKTRQMNWKQLKKKFPNMSPTADADFDGLINSRDCKPLDPSKDGAFSSFIGGVAKGVDKVVAAVKTKSEKVASGAEKAVRRITPTTQKQISQAKARQQGAIVRTVRKFSGVGRTKAKAGKASSGQKQAGAGRPKQSYKYKDPRTGRPISAVDYHRLRKQLKSQAQAVETKAEVSQRFALAKRGLSPEEVAAAQEEINAKMARLRAIKEAKQMEEQLPIETIQETQIIEEQIQQVPAQVVQQVQPQQIQQVQLQGIKKYGQRPQQQTSKSGIPPGYRLQEDLMTGRKALVPVPQPESWTQ